MEWWSLWSHPKYVFAPQSWTFAVGFVRDRSDFTGSSKWVAQWRAALHRLYVWSETVGIFTRDHFDEPNILAWIHAQKANLKCTSHHESRVGTPSKTLKTIPQAAKLYQDPEGVVDQERIRLYMDACKRVYSKWITRTRRQCILTKRTWSYNK